MIEYGIDRASRQAVLDEIRERSQLTINEKLTRAYRERLASQSYRNRQQCIADTISLNPQQLDLEGQSESAPRFTVSTVQREKGRSILDHFSKGNEEAAYHLSRELYKENAKYAAGIIDKLSPDLRIRVYVNVGAIKKADGLLQNLSEMDPDYAHEVIDQLITYSSNKLSELPKSSIMYVSKLIVNSDVNAISEGDALAHLEPIGDLVTIVNESSTREDVDPHTEEHDATLGLEFVRL